MSDSQKTALTIGAEEGFWASLPGFECWGHQFLVVPSCAFAPLSVPHFSALQQEDDNTSTFHREQLWGFKWVNSPKVFPTSAYFLSGFADLCKNVSGLRKGYGE